MARRRSHQNAHGLSLWVCAELISSLRLSKGSIITIVFIEKHPMDLSVRFQGNVSRDQDERLPLALDFS